jgi:hypothetical protein
MAAPIPTRISGIAWRLTAGVRLIYVLTAGGSLAIKDAVVEFLGNRRAPGRPGAAPHGNLAEWLGREANAFDV